MTTNTERVHQINKLAVLKIINQEDPFTRSEVVRKAELSLPTVTTILSTLIEEGYVAEVGNDKPQGGRPAVLYQFNPMARYVVGVEIKVPKMPVGLIDLQENIIALEEYAVDANTKPDDMVQILQEGIAQILSKQNIEKNRLVGIGLGIPGFVDRDTGDWLRYPRMPFIRDIPLRCILSQNFGGAVFGQNVSHLYAQAELRYGNNSIQNDALFITWAEGIKATVMTGSHILSGRNGNFGAIGHLVVVENGRPCYCGGKGCLETYASDYALREVITQHPDLSNLQLGDVFRLAAEGDTYCKKLVEDAVPHTAHALASLVRLTDINELILLGTWVDGGDYLLNLLYDDLSRRLPGVAKRSLSIRLGSKHKAETIVKAAAAPVIENHFELTQSINTF